jgi:proliferating cell nuclear antigen PCNA
MVNHHLSDLNNLKIDNYNNLMEISFSIEKVSQYFKIITLLKDILSSSNFQFKPSGIHGNTLTDSKIGLIEFFIPKEQLKDYVCTNDKIIGIDLNSYYTILKCIGTKVSEIKYSIKEDKIDISATNTRKTNISMHLMNLDLDSLTPDTDYETIVKMDSKELYTVIKDLNDLGDEIIISINNETITFSTDNCAVAKTNFSFDNLDIECDSPITMKYTGKELLKYVKACNFASNVSLYFAEGLPLTLHYECDDNFGWFRMFLAPMSE